MRSKYKLVKGLPSSNDLSAFLAKTKCSQINHISQSTRTFPIY